MVGQANWTGSVFPLAVGALYFKLLFKYSLEAFASQHLSIRLPLGNHHLLSSSKSTYCTKVADQRIPAKLAQLYGGLCPFSHFSLETSISFKQRNSRNGKALKWGQDSGYGIYFRFWNIHEWLCSFRNKSLTKRGNWNLWSSIWNEQTSKKCKIYFILFNKYGCAIPNQPKNLPIAKWHTNSG